MICLRRESTLDHYEGCEIDIDGELREAQEFIKNNTSLGRVIRSIKINGMLIAESWAGKSSQ